MSYSVYVDHPESSYRREQDFTAWNLWAANHAPWTGVGVDDVAHVIGALSATAGTSSLVTLLNEGGVLDVRQTRMLLNDAEHAMSPAFLHVVRAAVDAERGLRVSYAPSPFGGLNASAWLAKFGSAEQA